MATSKSKKYAEGGLIREQKSSDRIQNRLNILPSYQKLQAMQKQVGESGPTPAQAAQAQQYIRQAKSDLGFRKLIKKAQSTQQRQDQPAMAKGGMVKKKMSAYNAVYMGKDKGK